MQHLKVSGAVRPLKWSLGVKWLKKYLPGKNFDDDDEVEKEVMRCFKVQAADFCDSGFRSWFQDLVKVWTMPATMLKNKVMYRKFIHSVAFVN